MNFDLADRTIFRTLTGSRVYGTSSENSDYDYRGVAIPPKPYFFGTSRFEQGRDDEDAGDEVIYEIRKFLSLAGQNNPNILELLFVDPKFWVFYSPYWERIIAEVRPVILSKRCYHTYRGFAHSQLRRVRTHRGWLLQGELKEPQRSDFGLPEAPPVPSEVLGAANAVVARFLQSTDVEEDLSAIARLDKSIATSLRHRMSDFLERTIALARSELEELTWKAATKQLGYDTNWIDLLLREKRYQQAKAHYHSWLHWKKERNPVRKEIEARCGFDAKHILHVFRLLANCKEILEEGVLNVTRPDADFLRKIRDGGYSFEELEEKYTTLDAELDLSHTCSKLPHSPDQKRIEWVLVSVVESYLNQHG
jgi:uncharacterized protein